MTWSSRLSGTHRCASALFVLLSALADRATASPCIDVRTDPSVVQRTMAIEKGGADLPIDGATVSLDSSRGEVGVRTEGSDDEQRFKTIVLKLGALRPNPAAQAAPPTSKPLGQVSLIMPLAQVAIVNGIVSYPGCTREVQGHQIGFDGTLTVRHGKVKVDGFFTDYAPSRRGISSPVDSVFRKPG